MGLVSAIKRLLPAPEPGGRQPLGRQGLDIKRARKALAAAIAERNQARDSLSRAREQLVHVEGHASACSAELETAEALATQTSDAAVANQREHLARGEVPPQLEAQRLAREAAEAQRALPGLRKAAASADAAAADVLPNLQEAERFADATLARLEAEVADLARAVVRAELDERMMEIYPLLERVRGFYALCAVADRATKFGLVESDVPIVRCWFPRDELERRFRDNSFDRWRAWAQRLREAADASF